MYIPSSPGAIHLFDPDPFQDTVLDIGRNLLAGTNVRRLTHKHLKALDGVDMVGTLLDTLAEPRRKNKRNRKKRKGHGSGAGDEHLEGEALRKKLRWFFRSEHGKHRPPRSPGEPVRSNILLMGKLLGLDRVDQDILLFLMAMQHSAELTEETEIFSDLTMTGAAQVIAAGLCQPVEHIHRSLSRKGRLTTSGVVKVQDNEGSYLQFLLEVRPGMLDLALTPGLDRQLFLRRFLPEAPAPELRWEDFEHLGSNLDLARDLLRAALDGRHRGLNLLLYGPTGTGKTELARVLARGLDVPLYTAGVSEEGGGGNASEKRLSVLLLGQRLLSQDQALLLFDEMEDLFDWQLSGLFGGGARGVARMSKQWFNERLESSRVPTIWISNQIEGVDPAFVRRFTFALEMSRPGSRQRARTLRRHLGPEGGLTDVEVEDLAMRHRVSPAQLATAVRAATAISGDLGAEAQTIERLLAPLEKILGDGGRGVRELPLDLRGYRLDVLNSATDLVTLADQIEGWSPGRGAGISICLYGTSGTGKSEYVKYLAHRAGRLLHRHPASDLLSKWVGGTEQHIASAFKDAEDAGAVLLFDEADSFLRNRQSASHSWEVTQVNEFLQQLEGFKGIVACTTNLKEDLDAASLRRFVFKIELFPLRPEQARALFDATLKRRGAPPQSAEDGAMIEDRLALLPDLTPGDFAAVVRRLSALGVPPNTRSLLEGLLEEFQARKKSAHPAGFVHPRSGSPTAPWRQAEKQ